MDLVIRNVVTGVNLRFRVIRLDILPDCLLFVYMIPEVGWLNMFEIFWRF